MVLHGFTCGALHTCLSPQRPRSGIQGNPNPLGGSSPRPKGLHPAGSLGLESCREGPGANGGTVPGAAPRGSPSFPLSQP